MSESTMKIIGKVILGVILLIIILSAASFTFLMLGKEKTLKLELNGLSLEKVEDGTYTGKYNGFRWTNTVEVTVEKHKIIDIQEVRSPVFAKDETIQELIKRVIEAQETKVDAISGATADSKAFLKAIENALQQ